MMHELIDNEYPRCLYCQNDCVVGYSGEKAPMGCTVNVETLTCFECPAVFEIHSIQSSDGETSYTSFVFTCKSLCVVNNYSSSTFRIGDRDLLWGEVRQHPKTPVDTEVFEVDFSDKNKLYDKLKLYLTFS